MAEIVLAEDTVSIREGVKALLESDFHSVRAVSDGTDALWCYRRYHPALLILDVMMPKMDGLEVLKRIRVSDPHTPVMLLTAKAQEEDKVQGFGNGCDDYLTKPFGARELLARVSALLRRSTLSPVTKPKEEDAEFSFCGGMVVPLDRTFVDEHNHVTRISDCEVRLMRLLALNACRTVRKDLLVRSIWGGQVVASRTVDTHVANIRRKLGRRGAAILSVYGIGYKYLANRG